jgi:hypothetical protein
MLPAKADIEEQEAFKKTGSPGIAVVDHQIS